MTARVDTSSHEQDGAFNVSGFLIVKPMASKFPRQNRCMMSKSPLQFDLRDLRTLIVVIFSSPLDQATAMVGMHVDHLRVLLSVPARSSGHADSTTEQSHATPRCHQGGQCSSGGSEVNFLVEIQSCVHIELSFYLETGLKV